MELMEGRELPGVEALLDRSEAGAAAGPASDGAGGVNG
jgi:hypothetical protein